MFPGITSFLSRKRMSISLSSIGTSQPLYGMVNQPVLGFVAGTYLDDLPTIGFKDFNPMWSFPTTSVNQNWEQMTFGMAPWHLVSDSDWSKEALQSQSPIAVFKACNVTQAIGIAYSKIVLPNGDSKSESKNRTYCPTAWNNSYTWQYATDYVNCVKLVQVDFYARNVLYWSESSWARRMQIIQIDSVSTVMCGAMISLTPCIATKVDCQPDLHEIAEFQDAMDMIQQLNSILSRPIGFPAIPAPRKDCHTMTFPPKKRHSQYVMCPEQDCEGLVYMTNQNKSMIEALELHEEEFWQERAESRSQWPGRIALFHSNRAAAIASSIPITGAASSAMLHSMDQLPFHLETVHSVVQMPWMGSLEPCWLHWDGGCCTGWYGLLRLDRWWCYGRLRCWWTSLSLQLLDPCRLDSPQSDELICHPCNPSLDFLLLIHDLIENPIGP